VELTHPKAGKGGTRWRRFAAVMVPAVAVLVVLGVGVASGAVPVDISVSGTSFKVTADRLDGTNFVQYGSMVKTKDGKPILVAESGIADAHLTNMCQQVAVPGVGLNMLLRAGRGSKRVHATDLMIDMSDLSGDATFHHINIGQDASTLGGPKGSGGAAGSFGQRADSVTITHLSQTAYFTSAGSFTLPGLSLSFSSSGC